MIHEDRHHAQSIRLFVPDFGCGGSSSCQLNFTITDASKNNAIRISLCEKWLANSEKLAEDDKD